MKILFLLLTLQTFLKLCISLLSLFKLSECHHPSLPPTPLPPPYLYVRDRERQTHTRTRTVQNDIVQLHFLVSQASDCFNKMQLHSVYV